MTKDKVISELNNIVEEFNGTCWNDYIPILERSIELLEHGNKPVQLFSSPAAVEDILRAKCIYSAPGRSRYPANNKEDK